MVNNVSWVSELRISDYRYVGHLPLMSDEL